VTSGIGFEFSGPARSPSTVVSTREGEGRATMSEQPTDPTATNDAANPEAHDDHYGHLSVEDDPEGTTDVAELDRRHRSQDQG
jgi:hypothetical protein